MPRSKTVQMAQNGPVSVAPGICICLDVKMQWMDKWMDKWMDRIAHLQNEM